MSLKRLHIERWPIDAEVVITRIALALRPGPGVLRSERRNSSIRVRIFLATRTLCVGGRRLINKTRLDFRQRRSCIEERRRIPVLRRSRKHCVSIFTSTRFDSRESHSNTRTVKIVSPCNGRSKCLTRTASHGRSRRGVCA
jgi:hypothetical protein